MAAPVPVSPPIPLTMLPAEAAGATCIVTRNKPDFRGSPIPALTPEEWLKQKLPEMGLHLSDMERRASEAERRGLTPRARIRSAANASSSPVVTPGRTCAATSAKTSAEMRHATRMHARGREHPQHEQACG